jgi:hypothetical protein
VFDAWLLGKLPEPLPGSDAVAPDAGPGEALDAAAAAEPAP